MKSRSAPRRHADRPPTHPGALLRIEVLPAFGLSTAELAERLGVTRQALHKLLTEKNPLTPEMAARIGRLVGCSAQIWLRMQADHSLWTVERKMADQLDRIEPLHAA